MSILYPVAANAEAALAAPSGRAARERDAERVAGEPVWFVREFTGPVFKSEAAGLDAYAGRLDDERPERRQTIAPEDRYCELKPIVERSFVPFMGRHTAWRLSVGYWRVGKGGAERPGLDQARKLRKTRASDLAPEEIAALADQPLRPLQPQKALDIGLFETRLPENPSIIVADD